MQIPSYPITALTDGFIAWPEEYPLQITGLSSDSREVKPGDLFIAAAGPSAERGQFITAAIQQGAVAILQEVENIPPALEMIGTVPCYRAPAIRALIGPMAARFFGNPANKLIPIGITGTNGKTSCCQFIARILQELGNRCGVIGTLGSGFPDAITPGALTTPGAIELQHIIATLQQRGATYLAMEVSSHSLVQHRVAGIPFEIALFTNLTRDHLDYHGSMENYAQAKRLLFLTSTLKSAVINADDAFGRQLLAEFAPKLACYAYTTQSHRDGQFSNNGRFANRPYEDVAMIRANNIRLHTHGFSADIYTPWGEGELHSALLGRFNLSNLLAVLTTLGILGIPLAQILEHLNTLPTVAGRMQRFGGDAQPTVVVDYAHTPDALEKALIALREHSQQHLWCVFGCGGNRDSGKRRLMARIAETHSDHVIVTDDNPRLEDPQKITDDILSGFLHPDAVYVEHDRKRAIAYAIQHARADDTILIAGKGHESYQQIGATKIPFSDAEQVILQLNPHPNLPPQAGEGTGESK